MTTLRKLGLRGVRSYSQSEEESIEFLKPLTIIVGANGSGKTTIIEALKFVTTGMLPPLSDGGKSFVHDPKMDGTALVKAQVKLSFMTAGSADGAAAAAAAAGGGSGKQVLAIRNFQLSQKKAKREFKGMEAVISTRDADGRESSVSHKCADMEKLVPQLLGVSPAVLENVIFCHQEDSLWPLSDAKTLKDKFDDIFAATRYTKALEAIFKLRKEKAAEIKVMEADLRVLEGSLDTAHRMEDDLEATKAVLKAKADKSEQLGEEIKALEAKLARLGVRQDEIKQIQDSIAHLQAQRDVMLQEKQRASDKMHSDYSDTDEELRNIYATFKLNHAELVRTIEQRAAQLQQLESECVRSESDMSKLAERLGKLAAQEADYQRKKSELTDLANRLASAEAGGGGAAADPAQLLSLLKGKFAGKQTELEQHKSDARSLDVKFESEISELRKQESQIAEGTKIKGEQMTAAKQKRAQLLRDLSDLESAHRSLLSVTEQLREAESALATLSRSHDPEVERLRQEADDKTRAIQSNTQKLALLSAQRQQLASQAGSLAEIKLKRVQLANLLAQYRASFDSLQRELDDAHLSDAMRALPRNLPADADRLADVFGSAGGAAAAATPAAYSLDAVETLLKKQLAQHRADLKTKQDEVNAAAASVSSLQSQRRSVDEQLTQLQSQLATLRHSFVTADVESVFGGSSRAPLDEEVARSDKVYDKANNEAMLGSSAKLMYKRFIAIAQESHKCHLCNREFASESEEQSFLQSNTAKMDKIVPADKAERTKAAVKAAKARLEQLQALQPQWDRAHALRTKDIPALEAQLAQLSLDISAASSRKSGLELDAKRLRESEESDLDVLRVIAGAVRVFGDVASTFEGLQRSQAKLAAEAAAAGGGTGAPRSLDTVTSEFDSLQKLNLQLQKECSAIQDALERLRNRRQESVERVTRLKEQRMEMSRIEMEQNKIRKDEQENNQYYAQLKAQVAEMMQRLPEITNRLAKLHHDREEARKRSSALERQLQDSVSSMRRELDQYASLCADVDRFERQLKDRAEMKASEQAKADRLAAMRRERASIAELLKADQEAKSRNDEIDADIQANLEYRERERAIVAHQKKIDERLAQLKEASGGELLDDLRKLQARLLKLKEARSELRGAMASEDKQCTDLITQLTSDRYRHIDQRHTNALIDVRTHALANADLDTYYRALDKSLMMFHSIKMKEINETLKEYWRTVYKGADIDEIYIVSDGAIIGKKRNYNYRVVMKQGDTELDMRGRCSAGQKVLASLLIRLALADTFCSQCAVLALDEPTTNLDQKNITAFAQALNMIIQKRRDQSNFQLIVITHDEHFVDAIGKRAQAEYYYRVYKDSEQHSKIRKQAIVQDELMHEEEEQ